jgi:uracil-DNA glycosylase family 4
MDDGLVLSDAWISASVRCAPPDNKPTVEEIAACRPFFERELDAMQQVRVVVTLGKLAFDNYLSILKDRGTIQTRAAFPFGHGAEHQTASGQPLLIASYHPSQQNTSTGKLTERMLFDVFAAARRHLDGRV